MADVIHHPWLGLLRRDGDAWLARCGCWDPDMCRRCDGHRLYVVPWRWIRQDRRERRRELRRAARQRLRLQIPTHQGTPLFELTCRRPNDPIDVAQLVEIGEAELRQRFEDTTMTAAELAAASGANVLETRPSSVTVGSAQAWVLLERIGGGPLPVLWVARPFRVVTPGAQPVLPRARVVMTTNEVRDAVDAMLRAMEGL